MAGPPARHQGRVGRNALNGCKGCCSICMIALGIFLIIPGGALTGVGFAIEDLDNADDMRIVGLVVLGGGCVMTLLGCCLCCELCNKSATSGHVIRARDHQRRGQQYQQQVTGYAAPTGATPTSTGYVPMGANVQYPSGANPQPGTTGTVYRQQVQASPFNPSYPAQEPMLSPYPAQQPMGYPGPQQIGYAPQQQMTYHAQTSMPAYNPAMPAAAQMHVAPPAPSAPLPSAPPLDPEQPPSYYEAINS